LADSERVHDESKPIIQAFARDASEKSIREVSKIKQEKRLETILEAKRIQKAKPVTAVAIKVAAKKLDHKAHEPARKVNGFNAAYGLSGLPNASAKTAVPITTVGKQLTLEEFRRRVGILNVPASAKIIYADRMGPEAVGNVTYDSTTNELSVW